jgi:hypothetical protein
MVPLLQAATLVIGFLLMSPAWCGTAEAASCRPAADNEVCHVGAQLHLQAVGKPEESYLRHMRLFVERDMADYVFLCVPAWPPATIDDVARYLTEHRVHFLLQEPYPAVKERRYDTEDYKRIRAIAGDLFLGAHWGELDSSGLKPEDYVPQEALAAPTRGKVKEALLERVRAICQGFYHAHGVPFAHSSATLSHALFAEAGADMICSEVGENAPNVSMMIASNRGAARAYGRPWMIDHSTWWAPRGNAGEQVSPREGHTPWCMFTSLLLAAMGGADFAQLEVDWAAYDRASEVAGTGEPALLPWGRALKTLYAVTRKIGPRGETVTRFGILFGHESGWPGVGWRVGDVRATGLYDGIRHKFMQTRDADLSLKILDVFYPGFERCGWDPEYPGFLSESPLGVCDIVPDNLTPDKYRRYAVLVALGYHRMTDALRDTLRAYVQEGGILVCGDTLFLDEAEKAVEGGVVEPLAGCNVDLDPEHAIRLDQPSGKLDEIPGIAPADTHDEWQTHWLHPVQVTTGRIVARLNDAPYMIENRLGEGRVFFVTGLNMVDSSSSRRGAEPFLYANTLYWFLHKLKDKVGDGVSLDPWNGIEHVYNERPDGSGMLLVLNHGDGDYRRDVTMRNPRGYTRGRVLAQGSWESWLEGHAIAFTQTGNVLAWSFQLPGKNFILFAFD